MSGSRKIYRTGLELNVLAENPRKAGCIIFVPNFIIGEIGELELFATCKMISRLCGYIIAAPRIQPDARSESSREAPRRTFRTETTATALSNRCHSLTCSAASVFAPEVNRIINMPRPNAPGRTAS